MGTRMTLENQQGVNAPAPLSDEQCRRVADALESAQSENTRRNYAGQFRRFSAWCERENYFPLPAIKATAFTSRRSRGGSIESEDSALGRGRVDIALAQGEFSLQVVTSKLQGFKLRQSPQFARNRALQSVI